MTDEQDRRTFKRLELTPPVAIQNEAGQIVGGKLVDLSANGAQLQLDETVDWINVGKRIKMTIQWPQSMVEWSRLETNVGIIRHVEDQKLLGVQFQEPED